MESKHQTMTHTTDNTSSPARSALRTAGRTIALLTAVTIAGRATAAPAPTPASTGDNAPPSVKIDKVLLRRLTRDIVDGLPPDASNAANTIDANETDVTPAAGAADNATQPAETMHRPQVANPAETLGHVAGAMREAGDLLGAASDKREIRTIQDRAVAELDALIEAARASPPPSGGSPSKPKPDGQQPPPGDPKPGQPQQAAQTGTQAGTASSMNTDAEAAAERSTQQAQQWIERVWGHLPQRQREQLRQYGTDVFLPGYESMIEEYFKRLAEETDD